jgi:catechol 2,3-dioxygenase-like lactoylglutathione lyase family enzyme
MSRVQLALNVTDLEAAIGFYRRFFATEPAKVRPGYANFAIADPPLKLVLIEGQSAGGTLNHLGVEVSSTSEVVAAQGRLAGAGLATAVEAEVACCYAVQDKVWVDGPDAEPWEIYTVLADVEMPDGQLRLASSAESGSCGPGACGSASPAAAAASPCCDQPAAV